MNKFKLCLALLLGCVLVTSCTEDNSKSKINQMTGEALDKIMSDKKEKEKYFVIDVREPDEYAEGHVRYAVNISVNEIENRIAEIEDLKDKNVVTICRSGKRSQKAAEILEKHGFNKIYNARGVSEYNYTTLTKVANIRGKTLQELADTGLYSIVDARDEKDYTAGHLQGAIHASADTVESKFAELPSDKAVITYCYSGNRSFDVAEKLTAAGYTAINSLDGTKEYGEFKLIK
ncbi:rhodanese-like domain-containing protein [Treponema pedis]|uniref:rhodanese-like domain-containing protein n=1 Tax=Treponema pedis TaxID=409322 RepID=UPI0004945516|nr:rhodanese-like domain-containing protein [Treponema pedis]